MRHGLGIALGTLLLLVMTAASWAQSPAVPAAAAAAAAAAPFVFGMPQFAPMLPAATEDDHGVFPAVIAMMGAPVSLTLISNVGTNGGTVPGGACFNAVSGGSEAIASGQTCVALTPHGRPRKTEVPP